MSDTTEEGKNTHDKNALRIITTQQMYRADALTMAKGCTSFELMQRASQAIVDTINSRFRQHTSIAVVCGSGNNGGDGFVAASMLEQNGYQVRVYFSGTTEDLLNLSGDAKLAADTWPATVHCNDSGSIADFSAADLVVDCIFGAGINRPLSSETLTLASQINESGKAIVSVDLPSGVCGDTGRIFNLAVRADMTVTFFRKKPAHVLLPGKAYCGEVVVCDIGIDNEVLESFNRPIFENGPALWLSDFPSPGVASHKYERGHALVLSGPRHATGAARLAACAALRIGAGVVSLGSPTDALDINAMHLTEIMQFRIDNAAMLSSVLQDQRLNSLTIGPGLGYGSNTREYVLAALSTSRAVILDADALTSFEKEPEQLFYAIKSSSATVILTPHEGEFQRLFGTKHAHDNENVQSKVDITRSASATSGSIIVYKGSDTVVACPGGQLAINCNAPPWLATAGSGDVLAGTICGLLSQCQDFEARDNSRVIPSEIAFHLTCAAVWLHARAAALHGPGLIASDIVNTYPQALGLLSNR